MERRKFPRIETDLLVKYKVLEEDERMKFVENKDISGGGVCLKIDKELKKDTILAMELHFEKANCKIFTIGEVAWNKMTEEGNYETGIKFLKIAEEDYFKLNEIITEEILKG